MVFRPDEFFFNSSKINLAGQETKLFVDLNMFVTNRYSLQYNNAHLDDLETKQHSMSFVS